MTPSHDVSGNWQTGRVNYAKPSILMHRLQAGQDRFIAATCTVVVIGLFGLTLVMLFVIAMLAMFDLVLIKICRMFTPEKSLLNTNLHCSQKGRTITDLVSWRESHKRK